VILNFRAPRYPGAVQNFAVFGFLPHGSPAVGTGYQQSFYWNSKLLSSTNPMLRFGPKVVADFAFGDPDYTQRTIFVHSIIDRITASSDNRTIIVDEETRIIEAVDP
jgi:hypothetical protein